ncbi:hypothetical protein ACMA1I_22730 [Pontibacter sp. 13R65]|uniref:hypothetical protein n=1 Tax=Pontibacter sp. 13R65 TaxID=3127458 RepID=UPI00301E4CA4
MLNRQIIAAGKVSLIALLLFFGPVSCVFFEACPDIKPYFSIHGLRIYNLRYTGQGPNPWEAVGESEPVEWDDFFMRVGFEKSYHAGVESSGGSRLYALTCDQSGSSGARVGVDTLYLVTLTDYNDNYVQGDTLNSILLTNDWTSYPDDFSTFRPLELYMEENRISIQQDAFELKLTEPPSTAGVYRFKLVYALNNGDFFEAASKSVKLY